jgi:uncharacterized protein (TIGR02145 family)
MRKTRINHRSTLPVVVSRINFLKKATPMKTLKLLSLFALAFLFSHCGTTEPAVNTSQPSLLEMRQVLDTTESKFYQFADSTFGNPWKAIMLTADWLLTLPNIQAAEPLDSIYIKIVLKSGLTSVFSFNQIDADSMSLYRGGGGGSHLVASGTAAQNTISNKKVLIYAAAHGEFYSPSEMQKNLDHLTNSGLGFEVTLLTDLQCRYQVVDNFKNYGLVIIDSHGLPESFLTGSIVSYAIAPLTETEFKDIIDAQLGFGTYDKILAGELSLGTKTDINEKIADWQKQKNTGQGLRSHEIYLTSKYIQKLPSLENTVVFGNMCYSGYNTPVTSGRYQVKDPIAAAFMSKNPISYYGYAHTNGHSRAVQNSFSKQMEDSLVKALVIDLDSTGIAYKAEDNTEFFDPGLKSTFGNLFLRHYGADDYSYKGCGDTLIDPRDGQKYKTVCIGKQVWMAENLHYDAPGSICNDSLFSNCTLYGRLYTWDMIMQGADSSSKAPSGVRGICPEGWHLPSLKEYQTLLESVGGTGKGENALKDTKLWQLPDDNIAINTNSSGFSALPGGINLYGIKSSEITREAGFWSTTVATIGTVDNYYFSLALSHDNKGTTFYSYNEKLFLSCRCVKD